MRTGYSLTDDPPAPPVPSFQPALPVPPLSAVESRRGKEKGREKKKKKKKKGSNTTGEYSSVRVYEEVSERGEVEPTAEACESQKRENDAEPETPISARQQYDNFVKRIISARTKKTEAQRRLERKRKKVQHAATTSVISQIIKLANQAKGKENA